MCVYTCVCVCCVCRCVVCACTYITCTLRTRQCTCIRACLHHAQWVSTFLTHQGQSLHSKHYVEQVKYLLVPPVSQQSRGPEGPLVCIHIQGIPAVSMITRHKPAQSTHSALQCKLYTILSLPPTPYFLFTTCLAKIVDQWFLGPLGESSRVMHHT